MVSERNLLPLLEPPDAVQPPLVCIAITFVVLSWMTGPPELPGYKKKDEKKMNNNRMLLEIVEPKTLPNTTKWSQTYHGVNTVLVTG